MRTRIVAIRYTSLRILFTLLFSFQFLVSAQIPTEKVDSLNTAGSELQHKDPHAAIKLAKKAIESNRNGLYREGLYRSYLILGMAYTRTSTYDSAVAFLRKAEVLFSAGDELGLIKYYLGLNFCNLHGFESARNHFLEAETLFRESGDARYLADVFRALGFVEMHLENGDDALAYLKQALEEKRKVNMNATQELILLSEFFSKRSQIQEALRYAKMAREEANSFGDEEEFMLAALRVGRLYEQAAELDSALALYTDLSATSGYDLSPAKLKVIVRLSKLLMKLEEGGEAIQLIQQYLARADTANSLDALQLQVVLVELYFTSGEPRQAVVLGEYLVAELTAAGLLTDALKVSIVAARAAEHLGDLELTIRYQNLRNQLQQQLFDTKELETQVEWIRRLELLDLSNEITFESSSQEVSTLRRERMILLISLGLGALLIVLLVLILWYRNQMLKGLAEKDSIRKTMHQAQEDLYKQTLHMMHMNNCLNEVEEQVKLLMAAQPDQKLSKILKSIRMNKSMDRDWDNFNSYFGNVNVGFYEKLSERSDKLSNHDRRVCALIKLNLTNREIATILNIEVKSVSMIKYRIKKKLGLDDEVELSHYITQL